MIRQIRKIIDKNIEKAEWKTVIAISASGKVLLDDGKTAILLSPAKLKAGDKVLVYQGQVLKIKWQDARPFIPVPVVWMDYKWFNSFSTVINKDQAYWRNGIGHIENRANVPEFEQKKDYLYSPTDVGAYNAWVSQMTCDKEHIFVMGSHKFTTTTIIPAYDEVIPAYTINSAEYSTEQSDEFLPFEPENLLDSNHCLIVPSETLIDSYSEGLLTHHMIYWRLVSQDWVLFQGNPDTAGLYFWYSWGTASERIDIWYSLPTPAPGGIILENRFRSSMWHYRKSHYSYTIIITPITINIPEQTIHHPEQTIVADTFVSFMEKIKISDGTITDISNSFSPNYDSAPIVTETYPGSLLRFMVCDENHLYLGINQGEQCFTIIKYKKLTNGIFELISFGRYSAFAYGVTDMKVDKDGIYLAANGSIRVLNKTTFLEEYNIPYEPYPQMYADKLTMDDEYIYCLSWRDYHNINIFSKATRAQMGHINIDNVMVDVWINMWSITNDEKYIYIAEEQETDWSFPEQYMKSGLHVFDKKTMLYVKSIYPEGAVSLTSQFETVRE